MAKQEEAQTAEAEAGAETKRPGGRAVTLPNGQRRIDYIRDQYYVEGKSRSEIKNAINKMMEEDGQDARITYQIVFQPTSEKTDPRQKPANTATA